MATGPTDTTGSYGAQIPGRRRKPVFAGSYGNYGSMLIPQGQAPMDTGYGQGNGGGNGGSNVPPPTGTPAPAPTSWAGPGGGAEQAAAHSQAGLDLQQEMIANGLWGPNGELNYVGTSPEAQAGHARTQALANSSVVASAGATGPSQYHYSDGSTRSEQGMWAVNNATGQWEYVPYANGTPPDNSYYSPDGETLYSPGLTNEQQWYYTPEGYSPISQWDPTTPTGYKSEDTRTQTLNTNPPADTRQGIAPPPPNPLAAPGTGGYSVSSYQQQPLTTSTSNRTNIPSPMMATTNTNGPAMPTTVGASQPPMPQGAQFTSRRLGVQKPKTYGQSGIRGLAGPGYYS